MPTKRMIDPEFWQSESMAELSREERLFFIGLISNADDQGRLKAHPALLRSQIYPYDEDVTPEMISLWLEAVQAVESAFVYAVGSKTYIQIVKWWSYQSPQWAYPSKIPPPQDWQDKLKYRKNNKVIMTNWDGDGGFSGAQDVDAIDYTHLGKALPKAKGKPLVNRNSIALEIEIDNNSNELPEKPAEAPGPKTLVMNEFIKDSHLKMPKLKRDQGYWWSEMGKILHETDNDAAVACDYVSQTVKFMRGEKMAIKGPQSILWGIIQLSAGEPLATNGAHKNAHQKNVSRNSSGSRLDEKPTYNPYTKTNVAPRA